ncbi:hypothetical protein [Pelagibacterium montanilacus]|uniref:hypothetical protein n=1 Tax=Pelagibacterium montanilacus TaxID=2185280 RepID=UPI000F8E0383|nr:hypothetical protein [Pelagibacterium montanilacus]
MSAGLLVGPVFGLPIAYMLGIWPALVVGTVAAITHHRSGRARFVAPLICAVVLWGVMALLSGSTIATEIGRQTWVWGLLAAQMLGTLGSLALCDAILGRGRDRQAA